MKISMDPPFSQSQEYVNPKEIPRSFVYLLSLNWLNAWKKKVGFNQCSNNFVNSQDNSELPEMNEDLIDHNYLIKHQQSLIKCLTPNFNMINDPIKNGLEEDKDFIYCNKKVWDYFVERYGNPKHWLIKRIAYYEEG